MPDAKVADLTAASALDGTELYYGVQGGANRKVTGEQIKTLAATAGVTIDTTTITGGTTTRLLYDNAGTVGETAGVTFTGTGALSMSGILASTVSGVNATLMAFLGGGGGYSTTIALGAGAGVAVGITVNSGVQQIGFGSNYDGAVGEAIIIKSDSPAAGAGNLGWNTTGTQDRADLILRRGAAATLQQGASDAAAPVAQTLTVQSVVAGTANTAGADFTISGSKGTGTGAGGSIVFKTAPAGSTGTSQNALATSATVTYSSSLGAHQISLGAGSLKLSDHQQMIISTANFPKIVGDNFSFATAAWAAAASYFYVEPQRLFLGTADGSTVGCNLSVPVSGTWQFGEADAAAPVAQTTTVQSVVAGTTDTAGTAWTFQASKGTGTGAGGNVIEKTAFSAKSTGSGQGTAVDRNVIVAKGKVLTDATPVSLFEIALPTLTMCGGQIEATVVCTNDTDMQSFTQTISYSAVNKGGVYTKSITASAGDKSVTGGSTIANTWTLLDGTNKVTVQLSSDTSLTPSSNAFMCYYSVKNNSEQATTIL